MKQFAEFFAGIGLVRAGLEPTGWHCAYANDIDAKKKEMYEGHFGPSPEFHCGDIWNRDEVLQRLPDTFALATASFPCVDLSIAGNWKGLDGKHSSTFFAFLDVLRALKDRRPPVVLIENVVGFLKSQNGQDFTRACQEIAKLGYWLDAFVLDAKWFVPQSRPRVFLVGVQSQMHQHPLFSPPAADLFGFADNAGGYDAHRPSQLRALRDHTRLATGWLCAQLPPVPNAAIRLSEVLDGEDKQEWWDESDVQRHLSLMQAPSYERLQKLLSSPTFKLGTAFRRTRLGKPRTEVRFDIAGCLRTPKGGSARQIVVRVGKGRIDLRWMSAREYARLQGAPDYRFTVPNQQAMYGFGDAVCVPAIEWIDRNVLTPLVAGSIPASGGKLARHVLAR